MNRPQLDFLADLMFQEISGAEGLPSNEHYDSVLKSIIAEYLNRAVNVALLTIIPEWENRLERFRENPDIAKGMDSKFASGVDSGRTKALADCIKDLGALLQQYVQQG